MISASVSPLFAAVGRAALIALVLLGPGGCATPVIDFQEDARFGRYATAQLEQDGTQTQPRGLDQARVEQVLRKVLPEHGLRIVEADPDLRVTTRFIPYRYYDAEEVFWGAGAFGPGWGLGMSRPVIVDERKTWRLEVELVDVRRNQVVWKALSSSGMEQYLSPRERAEWVRRTVTRMFEGYPPGGTGADEEE